MNGAACAGGQGGILPALTRLGTRRLAVVLVSAALLAACGGSSTATTETPPVTPTTVGATTSLPPPTTEPAPSHTTPDGSYTLGEPSLVPPASIGSDEASGSGCPPTDFLPDGIWFGFAKEIRAGGLDFDPACFFFGEDVAARAAAEDGAEPPPNPFYIRNPETAVLDILIAAETVVHVIVPTDELTFEATPFESWPDGQDRYTVCPGELCTVWVALNEGTITEVMEQYVP